MVLYLCHNPYFNRWFSAINAVNTGRNFLTGVTILILIDGFLQFKMVEEKYFKICSHNPYFNRWFSAMLVDTMRELLKQVVTILILIDGFLQ